MKFLRQKKKMKNLCIGGYFSMVNDKCYLKHGKWLKPKVWHFKQESWDRERERENK